MLDQDLPASRKEAIEKRIKFYFNGKECPKGHVAKRQTASGHCCKCAYENSERHKKKIKELLKGN